MFWFKKHFQKGITFNPTPKIEAYQATLKILAILTIPSLGMNKHVSWVLYPMST